MAESSPKWVENTVGKGEIARFEQFLLFPQCFQKTYLANTKKPPLIWERVNLDTKGLHVRNMKALSYTSTIQKAWPNVKSLGAFADRRTDWTKNCKFEYLSNSVFSFGHSLKISH